MKSFTNAAALIGAALTLLSATIQAAPPANDNFASRTVLSGQAVSSNPVLVDEATREGLERSDTGNKTLWYNWTAPQDGIVNITDAGTDYDGIISVYTGSELTTLVRVVSNDNSGVDSVYFHVKTGLTYQICLGAYHSDATGVGVLNLINSSTDVTAPVVVGLPGKQNDNFDNAFPLTAPVVSAFTYNADDSREGQETPITGNRTVWYRWTAPADAQVTMNTAGTDFDAILCVFNGEALSSLALVARNDNSGTDTVSFPTKKGVVYRVAVGAYHSDSYGTPSPHPCVSPRP